MNADSDQGATVFSTNHTFACALLGLIQNKVVHSHISSVKYMVHQSRLMERFTLLSAKSVN